MCFSLRLTYSARLQETCFSQRRLIFADGQVYFHCQRAIWREDFAAEDINMRCNLGEFDNAFAINNPNMPPTEQYAKLVREYSRRKLTYDSDAMNAFKGALQFLESTLETRCYSGLPEAYLNWALLWASSESLIRRTAFPFTVFPSYSWVGWKGEVRFPRLPGGYTYLEWLKDYCWIEYGKRKLDGIDVPLLDFESLRALFKLGDALPASTEAWKTDEGHQGEQAPPRRRWLLDSRSKICGYINIDDPVSCPPFEDDVVVLIILSVAQPWDLNRFEDVKIAYSSESDGDSILPTASEGQGGESTVANETTSSPWTITQPSPKAGTKTNDHGWGYRSEKDNDSFNFDFYNVMLVHVPSVLVRPDDSGEVTVKRVSERVGLGILHHKALNWALEEPWENYILLD